MSVNFTAHGTNDLPLIMWELDRDPGSFVMETVSSKEAIVTIRLTVSEETTLIIPKEVPLKIEKSEETSCLTNHGTLINNSAISLSDATPADIKRLRLTDLGLIQVPSGASVTYYASERVKFGNHKMKNPDLSSADADQGDLKIDGYHQDNADQTLTLNDLALTGTLTLPDASDGEIEIVISKENLVDSIPASGSYRLVVHIISSTPPTI